MLSSVLSAGARAGGTPRVAGEDRPTPRRVAAAAGLIPMRFARELPPGAFAFVMSSGIVSTGCELLGWSVAPW